MGEMADFANEYQDSTMDEYYGYFNGTVDIPYGEQIPERCEEFELPISYEECSAFLDRVDTLGISQAYPTNLTTRSNPPTAKKIALKGKAIDNLSKESPTCNICEEGMASRMGKYGKFYYCSNQCSGQKTVSESYWLGIKKAAGVSTYEPMLFSSEHHLMRIGDMVIWNKKKSHTQTLKQIYNLKVGEELSNLYIGGDYYQFSRPDEINYLLVKFDQYSRVVGRTAMTKDFLVQSMIDSIE